MNRTILFAGIGALGTALLVAMLLSALMGGKPKEEAPLEILVAKRDLPIGSELSESNTTWQKWPGSRSGTAVSGSFVRDVAKDEEWLKQKIRRPMTKDEPITSGSLMLEDASGSLLSAALEKNMRAISIDVKAATGVSGFLSPDDRVDVILTYPVRIQANNADNRLQEIAVEKASETILESVRVLATDQDAGSSTKDERQVKINKTITLEVTKEGAEKLALATQMGEIYLALRQMGDEEKPETMVEKKLVTDVMMGRTLNKLVETRNSLEGAVSNQGSGSATVAGPSVRVYNGTNVTEVPVRAPVEGVQ